jgi:vacuolar protein sorting-associated protein 54
MSETPLEMSQDEFAGVPPSSRASASGRNDHNDSAAPSSERQKAMEEARRVLDVCHEAMDGFNLLGVVANPRGPHEAIRHHRTHSARITSSASAAMPPITGEHGSGLEDTLHALESTLSQVTEQVDAINYFVDSWSRQYLGTLFDGEESLLQYVPPSDVPMGQLTELPPELANLSLASVQEYLEQTGVLAHSFDERLRFTSGEEQHWHESIAPDSEVNVERNEQEFMQQLEDTIPSRFFETYFDLTDSKTFEELLVVNAYQKNPEESRSTGPSSQHAGSRPQEQKCQHQEDVTDGSNLLAHVPECLSTPTQDILKLPPPETFTSHLDKIEIALLQQVRSKSIAFFHETNRFGQLKEWITGLVEEVQRIRTMLSSVTSQSVVAWELIPLLDQQRQDLAVLQAVLEEANDVIRCKSSIGGLLSANDDLGAAEQIQYGRKLLEENSFDKLVALKTVHEQLSQYENLVVANLGEELVEMFLDYKTFSNSGVGRIQDMIHALRLCSSWERVSQLYASRLLDMIRMTVRTTVGEFADEADSSVKACVTGMTLERFADCLDMLFEQLLETLRSAVGVQDFGVQQGITFSEETLTAAAELSSKSISELLRLRKETHSLFTLEEMKRLWDACLNFTLELEDMSNYKATALRSTLLAQAKAFVERQHESNMSSLVAALDSERWTQCDVSAERQAALTRLCSGRAVTSTKIRRESLSSATDKSPEAEVEGVRYKVVWSCLLLVEMLMNDIACAAHFQSLATNVVGKVAELLRLFNSRSTQLVLGAGAIHSAARLKSINAKHLSLVTQCLGMIISILPHVRAALMAQLPSKQHGLLQDLDKIKKEYADHNEKVLNKFVTIIGGIVEHSLAPRIMATNFDSRVGEVGCCVFLDGVSTNTKKMHQVLSGLLPPDHLQDVFSRIFAYVDQKTPDLFIAAATPNQNNQGAFYFPTTDAGKRQMLVEVETMTTNLNKLPGVRPWDFTAIQVLERQLEYELRPSINGNGSNGLKSEKVSTETSEQPVKEQPATGSDPDGGDPEEVQAVNGTTQ